MEAKSFFNSTLIHGCTMKDIEEMISRVIDKKLSGYSDQIGKGSGEDSELLSRKEAAKELRISPYTLTRWNTAGLIRCVHVGGRVYYSKSEIMRIIGCK